MYIWMNYPTLFFKKNWTDDRLLQIKNYVIHFTVYLNCRNEDP